MTRPVSLLFRGTASWPSLLEAGAAVVYLVAALLKLAGTHEMVAMYETLGVGQWLRYVTALCELTGAALLLKPRTAAPGAVLLIGVMTGAILSKLFVLHEPPYWAALLLVVLLVILSLRREAGLMLVRRALAMLRAPIEQ